MKSQDMAIVKSLVTVAWADGEYHQKEREMVDALIAAFEANEEEAKEIKTYAEEKRSLDDVPIADLSPEDRQVVLQHAILLTFVDRVQHDSEKQYLDALTKKLEIPDEVAKSITYIAEARARRFLNLLQS